MKNLLAKDRNELFAKLKGFSQKPHTPGTTRCACGAKRWEKCAKQRGLPFPTCLVNQMFALVRSTSGSAQPTAAAPPPPTPAKGGGSDGGDEKKSTPPADPLAPGQRVRVVGTSRNDLNGLEGVVLSYDSAKERYGVKLQTGATVALKRGNIALV
eukprot:CAMPEP_0175099342 /NCGR_PEP_ID=MMETSP0086_2-20121207/6404_1 /TAXON_ID=136419 /ORGANISM="Unknown Unknown, Strain D1" /LENGTH=154 /DNA_ID=CAMNT_0016373183 /DNA_START=293 /DNA_END=757 /DNA_ORIENTATION=+